MTRATFAAAGGANFIGASAYILKLSKSLSVDWGHGVNQGSPDGPQYDGPLDYLLLSHGHFDHIGLVPEAVRRWPHLKIIATEETKEIAKVVWRQTIHKHKNNGRFDSTKALTPAPFTEEEALAAEKAIVVVSPQETVRLGGEIGVTPIRSGHILGAVSYLIVFEGETYFFSGDICFHESFFVPGAPLYSLDRCRLLVRESVYLNEDFEDRQKVIGDFQQAAGEVLERGGQLLVPALSTHRTQEIYAIAVSAGLGPVYIDGSQAVTEIYRKHAPQNGEILENVPRFSSRQERMRLLRSEEPAIIVASSGMVYEHTLSAMWAENLLFRENCAIFTVNYLDPCSQGFTLNKSRKGQYIPFNGHIVQRLCEIRHFPLSAHMDKTDGQEMEDRLNPNVVVYVHGENSQMDSYLEKYPGTAKRKKVKAEIGKEIEL